METSDDLRKLSTSTCGLWPHYGAHPLPPAGPSLAAAILRVAGIRYVPGFSHPAIVPGVLAEIARWSPAFGHRRAFGSEPTGRTSGDRQYAGLQLMRHCARGNACATSRLIVAGQHGARGEIGPEVFHAFDRQQLRQTAARAIDAALDGADCTAADFGRLLVRES